MEIYKWCIAVLKGKGGSMRLSELFDTYVRHNNETSFSSVNDFTLSLKLFGEYFVFEEFSYDYVIFVDDEREDSPIIEQAKDVLRSHQNRYTLSVLCEKMTEQGTGDVILDEATLKGLLETRDCFTIEARSFTRCKLSEKGLNSEIDPLSFGRPRLTEEEKQAKIEEQERIKAEKKRAREEDARERREARARERAARMERLRQTIAKKKADQRVAMVKELIISQQITDETTLKELNAVGMIDQSEYKNGLSWSLYTVGDVYEWVKQNKMTDKLDQYRKKTVERMLKIASFYSPELVRFIPNVKYNRPRIKVFVKENRRSSAAPSIEQKRKAQREEFIERFTAEHQIRPYLFELYHSLNHLVDIGFEQDMESVVRKLDEGKADGYVQRLLDSVRRMYLLKKDYYYPDDEPLIAWHEHELPDLSDGEFLSFAAAVFSYQITSVLKKQLMIKPELSVGVKPIEETIGFIAAREEMDQLLSEKLQDKSLDLSLQTLLKELATAVLKRRYNDSV